MCSWECVYQIFKIKTFSTYAFARQYLMPLSLFSNYVAHFILY